MAKPLFLTSVCSLFWSNAPMLSAEPDRLGAFTQLWQGSPLLLGEYSRGAEILCPQPRSGLGRPWQDKSLGVPYGHVCKDKGGAMVWQ